MNTFRVAALAGLSLTMACEGFKDAMTAHVDVAARAGSQQLSVDRLANLMGHSQAPLRKEVAQTIADVWANYQLMAKAAATNDSLKDSTLIDQVMAPVYTRSRRDKWYSVVSQTWHVDTTNLDEKFNAGQMFAASHILFPVPAGQEATGSDSIRKKAESVLKQTNSANFAAMAKKYGTDATKERGGSLGVFGHGAMIPDFEKAIAALKPGEVGPLVKTQYGYHIVRRNTYAEVKDAFRAAHDSLERFKAESSYVANTEKNGNVQVKPNAAKMVKEIAADPDAHKSDRTVVATSTAGDFTAGQVATWIISSTQPPSATIRGQLQQAPDSLIPNFVKFLVRDELYLHQADSAKVTLDPTEKASIRQAFRMLVTNVWAGLHVSPELLADSAKTPAEKERLAASRVDSYIDRLVQGQEQFVEVPPPLANALRQKYDAKVNSAGLDRAVQAAQKIRASADSAKAAQQPKSAVPIPNAPPATPPPAGNKKG